MTFCVMEIAFFLLKNGLSTLNFTQIKEKNYELFLTTNFYKFETKFLLSLVGASNIYQ